MGAERRWSATTPGPAPAVATVKGEGARPELPVPQPTPHVGMLARYGAQLKYLRDYGRVGFVAYMGLYVLTLGSMYVAVDQGVLNPPDVASFLFEHDLIAMVLPDVVRDSPQFLNAWVMTKFTEPVRPLGEGVRTSDQTRAHAGAAACYSGFARSCCPRGTPPQVVVVRGCCHGSVHACVLGDAVVLAACSEF